MSEETKYQITKFQRLDMSIIPFFFECPCCNHKQFSYTYCSDGDNGAVGTQETCEKCKKLVFFDEDHYNLDLEEVNDLVNDYDIELTGKEKVEEL